jgi:hypothetical protein
MIFTVYALFLSLAVAGIEATDPIQRADSGRVSTSCLGCFRKTPPSNPPLISMRKMQDKALKEGRFTRNDWKEAHKEMVY